MTALAETRKELEEEGSVATDGGGSGAMGANGRPIVQVHHVRCRPYLHLLPSALALCPCRPHSSPPTTFLLLCSCCRPRRRQRREETASIQQVSKLRRASNDKRTSSTSCSLISSSNWSSSGKQVSVQVERREQRERTFTGFTGVLRRREGGVVDPVDG